MIGTAYTGGSWATDIAARREALVARVEERSAAIRRSGRTEAEGAFRGSVAPSGIGERGIPRGGIGGGIGDSPSPSFQTRAIVAAARRRGIAERTAAASARRQDIMSAARERETARRLAQLETAAETAARPATEGIAPERSDAGTPDEWRGVSLRTVAALASEGWPVARRIAAQLEGRYAEHRAATLATVALMAGETSNEGRAAHAAGMIPRGAGVVNGTEVRQSERWAPTPARDILGEDGLPIDRAVYSVAADGTRTLWTAPPSETETAPRVVAEPDAHAATLRATVAHLTAGVD